MNEEEIEEGTFILYLLHTVQFTTTLIPVMHITDLPEFQDCHKDALHEFWHLSNASAECGNSYQVQ